MSAEMHMRQIHSPFTEEQVDGLNWYQHHAPMHPFTCAKRDVGHPRGVNGEDHGILRATKDGWVCDWCTYTQDWAWAFMADPANFPSLPWE